MMMFMSSDHATPTREVSAEWCKKKSVYSDTIAEVPGSVIEGKEVREDS